MKNIFKKSISFLASILFLFLNAHIFAAPDNTTLLLAEFANKTENSNENEESNNFNFIKSKEEVRDFLYDSSLLLYGGIGLVSVSAVGIIITFLPRKRKKKRKTRSHSGRHTSK